MTQAFDSLDEIDLYGPLPEGFDEFDYGVLNAGLLDHSLLHNPSRSEFGITPSDLVYRQNLELEMRRLECLAQAKALLLAAQEQAQAVAAYRAQAQHHSTQAADQPRPEISAGHALASITLTPRLLAQRPFIARVGARGLSACAV